MPASAATPGTNISARGASTTGLSTSTERQSGVPAGVTTHSLPRGHQGGQARIVYAVTVQACLDSATPERPYTCLLAACITTNQAIATINLGTRIGRTHPPTQRSPSSHSRSRQVAKQVPILQPASNSTVLHSTIIWKTCPANADLAISTAAFETITFGAFTT